MYELKKKIIIGILCAIVVVLSGVYIWGYSLLGRIQKNKITKNDDELGITKSSVDNSEGEGIINIAFFGVDRRSPNQSSRSDSIMVISIDSKNQRVKASSLMRDMYVPIQGHGETKINHSYAYGGPVLAIKTINSNFDLDIRNYVTIDFFGFEKMIDKIGGVEIDINSSEAKILNVKSGLQKLNGKQAIAYSRIRYVGNADYERTERQRKVLNEIFKKVKSKGVIELPGVMSTILPYVETSLSNGEILQLGTKVMGFKTEGMEQFRVPVDGLYKGQKIRGMSVLVPDIEKNKKKLHEFIYGM